MNKFNKTLLPLSLLGIVAVATATLSLAEDTDIYAAGTSTAKNPNVLVIIDNSANWNSASQHWPDTATCTAQCKQGKAELNALRTVIGELGTDVNLGLMMFTSGATDGAYPRFHIRQMTAANKTAFQQLLGDPTGCVAGTNSVAGTNNCIYQNFNSNESSGGEMTNAASTKYSSAMFEAFKYFGGYTSPAHATDDVAGSPVNTTHFGTDRYTVGHYLGDTAAYSDAAQTTYQSPLSAANSCAKNYIVFIGNGYPSQDSASSLLTGVGGNATQLSVPDFTTITGVSATLIGTGSYASEAACVAAAPGYSATAYDSYSCTSTGAGTTTTALGTSSCGQAGYGSAAACVTSAATDYPGYSSYSCTAAAACAGANFGTSSCGQYASVAACEAGLLAAHGAAYTSYSCALSASTCTPATDALNGGAATTCGLYATASACQSAFAISAPGYASYACTSAGGCTSADLDGNSCYASAATCQSTVLAANPGYSSVACGSAANCTSVITTTCAAANAYNTSSLCNAGAPAILGGTYNTYSCDAGANCAGGKTWSIRGTNQSYTATGTGTRWTVTGTNPAGSRYDMTGTGGGSTYTITGSNTTTNWNIYGNNNVTTAVPTGTYTGTSSNYADEWAKFLYQTDVNAATGQQNARTYAIDVFKDAQDANETKLLMSMAAQGGGKYFSASDENSIKNALRKIFSEIQSVNSVFASSSLPVSVNTQGTYLNQVFIGMFRPDGTSLPRWAGNLKQYQFDINVATNTLFLADKYGDPAISSTTGFITPCADSIWTTDTGNYWQFGASNAMGTCGAQTSLFPSAGSSSAYSDAPDGDVVEKGGAAQKLRGVTSTGGVLTASSTRYAVCGAGETPVTHNCRKLLTCDNATCTAASPTLVEFSTANAGAASSNPSLTAASLGALDDTERDLLINWVRGKDVDDENANTVITEVRPSVHGAVVHSQPAVIDYGSGTGVFAFYGADDGAFHAVNGDKVDADGTEAWGFIAPETYGRLKRFRGNSPLVNFPGTLDATATPKSYFFDGSIGVYQNSGTVRIYPTMRRGGRAIYAFDVSTPTAPTLLWRRGCFTNSTTDDTNCSTGWSGIGQTWSKPQVAYLDGYTNPVLIFGGGYDTCEDTDSQTRCGALGSSKGANIWFVDAVTGAILREYLTNYSVAGDVFVSNNSSSKVTAVHAVDTGGYVYRIDVGSVNAAGTTFTSWSGIAATDIDIANLSETNHARKFIFGPDVVTYPTYTAVLVGTGDREHPLATNYACGSFSASTTPAGAAGTYVTNQFFMVKETPPTHPATLITPADLTDVTNSLACSTTVGDYGWRFTLGACEQVVNKALSIGGVVYFGTNQPFNGAVTACANNLGTARGYAVKIANACQVCTDCLRSVAYVGGGLPPSPVAGVVDIGGVKVPFLLGGSQPTADANCVGEGCSALGGTKIEINPTGARHRMYWYIQND